ncbi:hypothetical protein FS837_011837 [Tulasnella sp. UAMH 9824]|nr:hypothetical protein FS837_011837 [Tulasnella sp. UAMH 9824]
MSHPVDEDTLMEDESHHFVAEVPRPVGPDPSGSPGGFEPSAKLRASIEKLAHWRIDPTSIDFDEGKAESHGGHATVSRGNLNMKGIDMRDMEKRALGKKMAGDRMNYFLWEREKMKKARWPKKEVAVKKMRVADDMDFERILGVRMLQPISQRFRKALMAIQLAIREAELLAELNHPNIVELEGFVEDACKGIVWLVFPWSFEGNLKDVIAKEKWEIPERISLIQLNVLIDCDWDEFECHNIWARIADFGSARRLPRRDPSTQIEEMVTRLPSAEPPTAAFRASTKTITLTGNKYTLRWAAPELLLEDQLSLWSGIWAMGWIIYEVLVPDLSMIGR